MNAAQIRSFTSTAKCLLTDITGISAQCVQLRIHVARGLRGGSAVMMQAAMMLSAHNFALRENRRNSWVRRAYQPDHVPDLAVHPRRQHLRGPKQRQLVRLRLHAGSGHGVRRWRRRRYRLSRAISPAGLSLGGWVAVMGLADHLRGVAHFHKNHKHVLIRCRSQRYGVSRGDQQGCAEIAPTRMLPGSRQ